MSGGAGADDIGAVLGSSSTMSLLVALAAVLLVLALLKLWLSRPSGSTVLLVGPCDAGKTTLFHQLMDGSTHLGTVASMQANVAEGLLASEKAAAAGGAGAKRAVQLIDIPGHPRVRGQMERHAERAVGLVFVLDSVDFMPRKTEAAEQLYEVLSQPALARRRTPLLLACNKQDLGSKAHTVDFIRKRLEKELDQWRSCAAHAARSLTWAAAAAAPRRSSWGCRGSPSLLSRTLARAACG